MNSRIFLLFFAVLLIFSNSTGFDLYSHSITYYFNNEPLGTFYNFFDLFVLPRYFLLSYIYEFISKLGMPLGYIIILLNLYPLNYIIKQIQSTKINNKISLMSIIFLFASYILIFFYSGLSLALLWAIAYFLTRKKIFIIGALFHPIGIIIFLIVSLVINNIKPLIYVISIFLCFVMIESNFIGFFVSGQLDNANIDLSNLDLLILYSDKIITKLSEIKFLVYLLIIYFIFKKIPFSFKIKYIIVVSSMIVFSIFITLYMSNKSTLLYYLYIDNNVDNYSIYATWFDFGEKDLIEDYGKLYSSRYEMNPDAE